MLITVSTTYLVGLEGLYSVLLFNDNSSNDNVVHSLKTKYITDGKSD